MVDNFAAGKTAKSEQTRKRIIHTFLSLIDEKKLTDFMAGEKDYGAPWYGQLMAGPPFIGYIVQMNYLLSDYKVRIL